MNLHLNEQLIAIIVHIYLLNSKKKTQKCRLYNISINKIK